MHTPPIGKGNKVEYAQCCMSTEICAVGFVTYVREELLIAHFLPRGGGGGGGGEFRRVPHGANSERLPHGLASLSGLPRQGGDLLRIFAQSERIVGFVHVRTNPGS